MKYKRLNYLLSKGYISAIILGETKTEQHYSVIKFPFHMSYPYLIEYENQIYCVPETSEANEVSLFVAKEFPVKWEKVMTLISDFAAE